MKKDRIEELFKAHSSDLFDVDKVEYVKILDIDDFTQAINQAEKELKLEWYKKLEKRLGTVIKAVPFNPIREVAEIFNYYEEIQNKIKELEDGN